MKTMIVKATTVCLVLGIVLSFGNEAEAKTMIKRSSESDESHDNEECTAIKKELKEIKKAITEAIPEAITECFDEFISAVRGKIFDFDVPQFTNPIGFQRFGGWANTLPKGSCKISELIQQWKLLIENYKEKCKSNPGNEAGDEIVTKKIGESDDNEECTAREEELEGMFKVTSECSIIGQLLSALGGLGGKFFNDLPFINNGGLIPFKAADKKSTTSRGSSTLPGGHCITSFTSLMQKMMEFVKECGPMNSFKVPEHTNIGDIWGGLIPIGGGGLDWGKSRSK